MVKEFGVLFENTPLETWWENTGKQLKNDKFRFWSDAARLAILYKRGGIYFDTDVLTLGDFSKLRNVVFINYAKTHVSNGMIIMDAFHPFLKRAMDVMANFTQSMLSSTMQNKFILLSLYVYYVGYIHSRIVRFQRFHIHV